MDARGPHMHTSNGQFYYPFCPHPSEVHIEVIAHHLANRSRYAGATQHRKFFNRIFYSVAEHSVYVARFVRDHLGRPDLVKPALLHDGPEAFNGDLIRPLKYSKPFREPFKQVEEINEFAIAIRFDLPNPLPPEIKMADNAVLAAELQQIVPGAECPSKMIVENEEERTPLIAPYEIQMMQPYDAKMFFLSEWRLIADL